MKRFIIGFLSACLVASPLMLMSCNQLKDSTQSNTTNTNTSFGDFDIL